MISRRGFMAGGVVLAGSYLVLPGCEQAPEDRPRHGQAESSLVLDSRLGAEFDRVLVSLVGTDALGAAWVAKYGPVEPAELVAEFSTILKRDSGDLASRLAASVREDFQRQRVCELSGWQLSVTECQLVALRHLLLLENSANTRVLAREHTVLSVADYPVAEIAPLSNWGPKSTLVGQPFNVQLDGHSGFWFKLHGAPAHARIAINGELVQTSVSADVVTSGLFDDMQETVLSAPGHHDISLIDPVRGVRQTLGQFVVRARETKPEEIKAQSFCQVENWGPRDTRVGLAKNEQPDGSMGIWVRSACMPRDAQVYVGDDPLRTQVTQFGLTALLPAVFLEASGEQTLYLYSARADLRKTLGVLRVE